MASLIKAKDNEDAMRIANDSCFGLGGGIFSKDEDAAIEMAEQHFEPGMVFINSFGLTEPSMPFGGMKESGYGREHGGFGLKEFVNIKSVMKRQYIITKEVFKSPLLRQRAFLFPKSDNVLKGSEKQLLHTQVSTSIDDHLRHHASSLRIHPRASTKDVAPYFIYFACKAWKKFLRY